METKIDLARFWNAFTDNEKTSSCLGESTPAPENGLESTKYKNKSTEYKL